MKKATILFLLMAMVAVSCTKEMAIAEPATFKDFPGVSKSVNDSVFAWVQWLSCVDNASSQLCIINITSISNVYEIRINNTVVAIKTGVVELNIPTSAYYQISITLINGQVLTGTAIR